jgi:indole-3-glycerol phosphate synthase
LDGSRIELIAEVKRASPSKGDLRVDLDVASLVLSYDRAGAAAVSVLTEPAFFKGSFADLARAREVVDLPLLCKDFIVDHYQVCQARLAGADCILLIVAALSLEELEELMSLAHQLGMSALVEVHDEQELDTAVSVGAGLVGINNRNLVDFSVDLGTTSKLAQRAPAGMMLVSESGIRSHADVLVLERTGVKAVLVGETLVTSPDPEAEIRELMGR